MRGVFLASAALLLLATSANPSYAQMRGHLTSQPAAATPLTASSPPLLIPVWWWQRGTRTPETMSRTTHLADGAAIGGVQLDVLPWRAQVYVDGALAGRVEDFRGYYHHLGLAAGPHVLTIVQDGYRPLVVDIEVVPGETVTYRATLSR